MSGTNPNSPTPASQDDLDALLAELGGDVPNRNPVDSNAATMDAGQDDIDALIGALGGPSGNSNGTENNLADHDDIEALLSEISNTAEGRLAGGLTPDQTKRIDAVLESLQSGPQPTQGSTPASGTLGLSSEDLEELVAKHAPGPNAPAPAEAMISQEDIDDLVAQLTAVVGGTGPITIAHMRQDAPTLPDSGGRPLDSITRAMPAITTPNAGQNAGQKAGQNPGNKAGHKADKPAPAGKPGGKSAGKPDSKGSAVPPLSSGERGRVLGGTATMAGGGAAAIGVLAPSEVRGARWLLVAAVLLLAICAIGMGAMVKTLTSLAGQLSRTDPAITGLDGERFALALTAARNQLGSKDPIDAAVGVQAIRRLQHDHPNRAPELTLELARHWRAHGAQRKAADEYAGIVDTALHGGDPRILLEYTESLTALGENEQAISLLYGLLAQEQTLLGREDALGHPKVAEDLARDQAAVQQAYLQLGQLLQQPIKAEATP